MAAVDSLNMFQKKKLAELRPTRPLWLMLALSVILPGLGHVVLGKTRMGLGLILASLLLGAALFGAGLIGQGHLVWLMLRLSVVVFLFAVTDAALASIERRDGREADGLPRQMGFLNLVAYGLGYWQLGATTTAIVAGILGALLHLGAGWLGTLPAVLGEVLVAGLGYHAYVLAQGRQRHPFTPGTVRPDTTPSWLVPGLALHAGAVVLMVVGGQALTSLFLAGQTVDQDRAVVVEPFYRNPSYGLSLEMNAPGWSFGHPAPNEFLVARHVAEDASIRVTTHSRIPKLQSSEQFAWQAVDEARRRGYVLQVTGAEAVQLDGVAGYRLYAEGRRGPQARRVVVLTAGRGWRQFTFWFEWAPDHDAFGREELDYMVHNLGLEG
jgi:hypothetical protein